MRHSACVGRAHVKHRGSQNSPASWPVLPATERSWGDAWLGTQCAWGAPQHLGLAWGPGLEGKSTLVLLGWDGKGQIDSPGPRNQGSHQPWRLAHEEGWEGFLGQLVTCGPPLSRSLVFTPLLHRLSACAPLPSLPCAPAHMTLGKCPYSARWLHWGLPSPEQISGTCAASLAGPPPVSSATAPCSVGQIPRRLSTGSPWPKQLPGSPGSLPDQVQGPRAKVSRWACLALNCCAAAWSRCQGGGVG